MSHYHMQRQESPFLRQQNCVAYESPKAWVHFNARRRRRRSWGWVRQAVLGSTHIRVAISTCPADS